MYKCYNCKTDLIGKGTLGFCCDKQTNTHNLEYSNLKSPDYKFSGDESIRQNSQNELLQLGLKYY